MTWSAQPSARHSLDIHLAACHVGAVAVGESEVDLQAEDDSETVVDEVLATWRPTRTSMTQGMFTRAAGVVKPGALQKPTRKHRYSWPEKRSG